MTSKKTGLIYVYFSADCAPDQAGALLARLAFRVFRRLRGFAFMALIAPLLLLCAGFGPPVMTDGAYPPIRLAPEHIDALIASRSVPSVTAASALVIDVPSGKTLFEKSPDEPRPPASTAKLMTALVTIDQAPLTDVVQVTERAAAIEGSRMGLVAGEQLTILDLLHGLLIPSGNDAAIALADYIAGSEEDFVGMMNAKAQELGLTGTRFVNAHGLDAEGQVMTARDLAELAQIALQNKTIAEIVTKPSAAVGARNLRNTNELLGAYSGTDGVKTGTTDEAGECLIASVTRGGRRTLVVELGSTDRYSDARKLFDYAASAFAHKDATLPDSGMSWVTDGNGGAYRLRSEGTSDIFVPAWQRPLLVPVVWIQPGAVYTSTVPVGELRWMLGGEALASVPLSAWRGP
jgi:serine-type D-Ala-D-Ala carboxypeptidase (penicillin-binding protein 5/6)